jgi:hypothetical protein
LYSKIFFLPIKKSAKLAALPHKSGFSLTKYFLLGQPRNPNIKLRQLETALGKKWWKRNLIA